MPKYSIVKAPQFRQPIEQRAFLPVNPGSPAEVQSEVSAVGLLSIVTIRTGGVRVVLDADSRRDNSFEGTRSFIQRASSCDFT